MLPDAKPRAPGSRSRLFLWLLVGLTVVALGLGVWRWLSTQQERSQLIAAQSKPSLTGQSRLSAPDFSLRSPNGQTISLADFRGKVVLINFWATWCPPCTAEMPDLNALHQKYGTEHNFVVLGVDFEEDGETVAAFADQHRLSFPVVLDSDGQVTTKLFGVRPLPTTFIVDREGFIRDTWNGQIAREAIVARLQRVW